MKQVVFAIAVIASQPTCANHPALTVGIGAGSIGLVSCEIQNSTQQTCGIITGAVGLGLGALAWAITELADTTAHELPPDDEMLPDGAVRVHTHTALPPVPIAPDAGVVTGLPAAEVDAGVPPVDAPPGDAATATSTSF